MTRAELLWSLLHNGAAPDGRWTPEAQRYYETIAAQFEAALEIQRISCGGSDPRCSAYRPEYGFTCILPPHSGPHYDTAGGHWDECGQRDAPQIRSRESPSVDPHWHRTPLIAQGSVLYRDAQPVVMCASPGLARDLAAELSAREGVALPLVRDEAQRREDVTAELHRQIDALVRRPPREDFDALQHSARELRHMHDACHQQRDEARDALRTLVDLKDGPRDGDYQSAKGAAWDRARSLLAKCPVGAAVTGKLIRDRVPDIIRQQGLTPIIETASPENYGHHVREKLGEELAEYLDSGDVTELADLIEVCFAAAALHSVERDGLMAIVDGRRTERGGFDDQIVWMGNDPGLDPVTMRGRL